MLSDEIQREFQALCAAVFDRRATEAECRRLEQLAASSPQLRREYVERCHLEAGLTLLCNEMDTSRHASDSAAKLNALPELNWSEATTSQTARRAALFTVLGGVCATIAFFALGFLQFEQTSEFAELVSVHQCRWTSSSVPIKAGERIGVGRLQLAEGVAAIEFDSHGARVELEGPADLEILSPTRCLLHQGRLVATVRSGFKGFTIETPHALLIDQGTSFGVQVAANGNSQVDVFEGRVDVEHRETGKTAKLLQHEAMRISSKVLSRPSDSGGEPALDMPLTESVRYRQINTAMGRGRDHWIQRDESVRKGPEELLLAKNELPPFQSYDRKIYLGFDLSLASDAQIGDATLELTGAETEMGYASRMGDATFSVYGVSDETLDQWTEQTMDWNSAPIAAEGAAEVSREHSQFLGQFTVPQGKKTGTFSIGGERLKEFLLADRNQFVTLVIVCETKPDIPGAIVYGFAGSRHPSLSPPCLRLRIVE